MAGHFGRASAQNGTALWKNGADGKGQLPAGAGLMIACMLGVTFWYVIIHLIEWVGAALR